MRLKLAALAGASALALLAAAPARATTSALDWALNSGSGAQPVYAVDNSNADVEIGTLNSSTHQFSLVATDVAGGSGASSSTFLRGDMTWAAPTSSCPAGSSTDVQYNNAGACAGNGNFTYDGSTVTFPDSSTHDTSGIAALPKIAMNVNGVITDAGADVEFLFAGSGRIDVKTGSAQLMQFLNNSGAGEINVNTGGVIGFGSTASPSAGFSWIGSGELALGNGTAGDASGHLDAAKFSATTEYFLPDGGTLKTAADTFGGYLQFTDLEFTDPTAAFAGGVTGLITPGWAWNAGLAFKGTTTGGGGPAYYLQGATDPLGWDLQFFNSNGYQVFGIEEGAEDNHSLELGGLRVCGVMYTGCGPSQILFTDSIVNGSVTGLGSLVGGSGYVNGTYQDVRMTGSATGQLLKLDVTVAGGVVTSAVLHSPARPGFWYHVGDVLTTSNANLGGTGSGFSITTTGVSSGAAAGPVIMMQSPQDFVGFGQAALGADAAATENAIRFGGSGNSGFPWDTNPAAQPSLTMGGALILGVGLAEEAQLRGTSAGAISVTLPNSATAAPLIASFFQVSPVTWADNQTCTAGQITADAGFVYVCTASNTVKRAALSTF